MPALDLSPSQRRALRAQAHHLDPVVMIGAAGLTEAVIKEAERCLLAHELIKVRVMHDEAAFRTEVLTQLCERLDCAPVQHIGKLLVLYRPLTVDAEDLATKARSGKGAAPRKVKVVVPSTSPNHRPTVKRLTVLGNQRLTQGGQVKRARKRVTSTKKGR